MKTHAELTEAQGLDRLFAHFDGLNVRDRHRRSVGNARAQARRGRTVPRGQSGEPRKLADFFFIQFSFDQRTADLEFASGTAAGPVVRRIVQIISIRDVTKAAVFS